MQPLLKITTTNAKLEYQNVPAKLEISQQKPQSSVNTKPAKLNMQSQAGRFEMNTKARRSDMGFKDVVERGKYDAGLAKQKVAQATTNYVDLGNKLINIQNGANVADAFWSQAAHHNKGELMLVPVSPIEMNYVPASLKTDFEPSEVQLDWNVGGANIDFVPGSFSINIVQHPSISFEYTGGPRYVPESANPDYSG